MSATVCIYNATGQVLDTTASLEDIRLATNKLIPPGAQALITVADANAAATLKARHAQYGAVDFTTVSNPATFTGRAYHTAGVVINGKVPPTV